MYAMQYQITLPADYDMEIIRRRVRTRGSALDAFPGLGLKAYLIREREKGSPVNQYAPFYLWHSIDGMNRFLWGGGGFHGIVDDFGRPPVEHWTGVGYERGPAFASTPRAATRRTQPVPSGIDPTSFVSRELDMLREHGSAPAVHSSALAIDPRHWELVRFTLWERLAERPEGETGYEVLHLSSPHLAELPTGRHW
ncbi:DUF4865 family protein [Streptomyces sp. RPT161]|uniref:DUF4865 family protein n=1 Tax=Streptomyces sp. RPT161 TaxID=3015993 RepID=UPI0022B92BA3|nr:DUF4865 family protein [Streptomyces sp. RPT161]